MFQKFKEEFLLILNEAESGSVSRAGRNKLRTLHQQIGEEMDKCSDSDWMPLAELRNDIWELEQSDSFLFS